MSCKKELVRQSTDDASNQTNQITAKLLAFKANLQLKSNSSIAVDSAEWYLEGLLNFEKANNYHAFGDLELF